MKVGLKERNVRGLSGSHLAYINKICNDSNALTAAKALQEVYCQVSDNSRITVGWAAIEHIFAPSAQHLLAPTELEAVLNAVKQLDTIPKEKQDRLKELLRNPHVLSQADRNKRLALGISERTGMDFGEVHNKVRLLAHERGRLVHMLSDKAKQLVHCAII